MAAGSIPSRDRDRPVVGLLVVALAILVAVASARDDAGSWNDRSRLATVECLVDYHTLAIDRSRFTADTADKLYIDGQFYSDKSPAPALFLAGAYQVWEWWTGATAHERPAAFCQLMTLASSGLSYVVAVWCIYRLGRPLQLRSPLRLLLTASFALATVAVVYARHVNNHELLLGVTAALVLQLAWLGEEARSGGGSWRRLAAIGMLSGLAYTIDLGVGPVLLVCTLALVAHRCRSVQLAGTFLLAALPWLVLHHAVNYAVGGTIGPANAVPEYLQWPNSAFNEQNMTGVWNHTLGHFLLYAGSLLGGKRGFFGHNLPLFLALPAVVVLLRRRVAECPELLWAVCGSGGTWLAYAIMSTNSSGLCCSIRWFVPLLAPGYYVLAVLLRHEPRHRADLLVLSAWGAVLMALAWAQGPWMQNMVPWFWQIHAAALASWLVLVLRQRRQQQQHGVEGPAWAEAA